MNIFPQADDAPEFVLAVEEAVNGVLRLHMPENLVLIKIDNWFGFKWLGFSGKMFFGKHTTLPIWNLQRYKLTDHIRIPPFVPERMISQRRFAAPDYAEIDAGEAVHRKIVSKLALRRDASVEAPSTAFAWYSGNSAVNGRGVLMAYVPVNGSYWAWYIELLSGEPWKAGKTLLVDPEWIENLRRCGRDALAAS